jgi:hypothetical protein
MLPFTLLIMCSAVLFEQFWELCILGVQLLAVMSCAFWELCILGVELLAVMSCAFWELYVLGVVWCVMMVEWVVVYLTTPPNYWPPDDEWYWIDDWDDYC